MASQPASASSPLPSASGIRACETNIRRWLGREPDSQCAGELVVRDEYLGWIFGKEEIDDYGVTFDHNVPAEDTEPEVLRINIIEIEDDGDVYANTCMPFHVDPAEYVGIQVLAVPRCCQKRRGTQDRGRINDGVADRVKRGQLPYSL